MSKFEVDADGFRELQAARPPWTLAREPVSNSFDEAGVTHVEVVLVKDGNALAEYSVTDDGPGFADIKDAYTLYADTYKRRDAQTRGRFNRGEKELLSVAQSGSVVTTSGSVFFEGDQRWLGRTRLDKGTRVEVSVRWTHEQCDEVLRRLRSFHPPAGKTYVVNGVQVPSREPDEVAQAKLLTVLKDDGQMRNVMRETAIHIHRLRTDEDPVLMELGIPIMSLAEYAVPFVIDVQQKVPMNPERDSVSPAYLRDVLAEVLNVVANGLFEDEANAKWVNVALPDERVMPTTVQTVKDTRIGNALILNPFEPHSNEEAVRHGFGLVSTKGWDPEVVQRFKQDADWMTTSQVFVPPKASAATPVVETPGMVRTRHFIEAVCRYLRLPVPPVHFVELEHAWAQADCSGSEVTFYVNKTGTACFDSLNEGVLRLVFHELGHLGQRGANPYGDHDEAWGERAILLMASTMLNPKTLELLQPPQ